MWDRDYLACNETDEAFADRWLRINNPQQARLWLDQGGSDKEYSPFGVRCENGRFEPVKNETPAAAIAGIIDKAILQVRGAALRAAAQWRKDLQSLPSRLQSVASLPELLGKIGQQCVQTTVPTYFQYGDRVKVHWWSDDTWYFGTVRHLLQEGDVSIEFDDSFGVAEFRERDVQRAEFRERDVQRVPSP